MALKESHEGVGRGQGWAKCAVKNNVRLFEQLASPQFRLGFKPVTTWVSFFRNPSPRNAGCAYWCPFQPPQKQVPSKRRTRWWILRYVQATEEDSSRFGRRTLPQVVLELPWLVTFGMFRVVTGLAGIQREPTVETTKGPPQESS